MPPADHPTRTARAARRRAAALALAVLAALLPGWLPGGPTATPAAAQGTAVSQADPRYVDPVPDDVTPLPGRGADPAARMRSLAALAPSSTAVVATAEDFPDALASGALQDDAMLVGAVGGRLDEPTRALLAQADVDRVVLLGGEAAVPDDVRADLPADAAVTRIAGAERTETAAAIARAAAEAPEAVLVARARGTGSDPSAGFVDAIGAGSWAAATGWPVLLVDAAGPSPATLAAVEALDPDRVVVIGGVAAVGEAAAQQLAGGRPVDRVAGAERSATAAAVATRSRPGGADVVLLLDGTDPQAWASGFGAARPLAQQGGAVLLLDGAAVPEATARALAELQPDRLLCAAEPSGCAAAREAAGLPPAAELVVDPAPGTPLAAGARVATSAAGGVALVDDGGCLRDGQRIGDPAASCTATFRVEGGDGRTGQVVTVTWPAIRVDRAVLQAPAEHTSPVAGGRWDFDQLVDARPEADPGNSREAQVDPAASVLRYGGQQATVPVIWSGYGGAARVAPDGLAVPVDTSRFRSLVVRTWTPGGGALGVEWRSCPTAAASNCIDPGGIPRVGRAGTSLAAGWQTAVIDLGADPAWAQGPVHMLYLTAPAGALVDDLRLTDGSAGEQVPVVTAAGVEVVWDRNPDPADNTDPASARWGVLPGGVLDSGVLPPGRYWLHAARTPGSGTDVGDTVGPVDILPGGPLSPTGPPPQDWARDVRGNPWDFAPGGLAAGTDDVVQLANATRVEGPGLTAVNAGASANPYLVLDVPAPIDSSRFTHLTVTVDLEGPFDLADRPGGGAVGRFLFQQGSAAWRTSNDIVLYDNQTTFTVDMTDPVAMEPGEPAWQAAPVTALRFDPNEDPGQRRWTVTSIRLTTGPPAG